MEAAGFSQEKTQYSFIDIGAGFQTNDRLVYRLKMVDLDGTFTYSQLVEVNWTDQSIITLAVFPNPGQDQIQIQYATSESSQILVLEALGRQIWKRDLPEAQANGNITLDINSWPTGIYIFQIVNKNQRQQIRFIKK